MVKCNPLTSTLSILDKGYARFWTCKKSDCTILEKCGTTITGNMEEGADDLSFWLETLTYIVKGKQMEFACIWDSFMSFSTNKTDNSN